MILKDKIPEQFYKLFRTKNMDYYMIFLVALYDENNEMYTSLGLTIEEGKQIIYENMNRFRMEWQVDAEDAVDSEKEGFSFSPASIISRLIAWGWLKRDFEETLNEYVISFPEYSQLYVELFKQLQADDSEREKESILSVYSALFTYHSDPEKNNDILRNALKTSKGLSQLLSNMQDGMRAYFDELSSRKDFIGIQEVLVKELNNSDSRKYAILTTTDSFYRYKEAVKELIGFVLSDNDLKKNELIRNRTIFEKETREYVRNEKKLEYCDEAGMLVYKIEREFDVIERKYNRLIEQKTVFAKRALARIHYIMQEGSESEDNTLRLIALLDKSRKKNEILEKLAERMKLTMQYENVTADSLFQRKEREQEEFEPVKAVVTEASDMLDFVPKPLYTKRELDEFRERNTKDGRFVADNHTVASIEDLEKLMFIWNQTVNDEKERKITVDRDISGKNGFKFSRLVIEE
ncbi:Wadjet anti-phage system protein JetA family protein [[Clostridium] polysaccharolyticum]|uniref:TIGR02677 family protein n=1 Tax=[Clostridium] polysaccharolyticum TaxID=29364 RepID=A0A1I0F6K3_9FIRM|nr:Wadjet anti-phage system protein JetA family protein [[Clostridium] polysaccharolyticum]SET53502.1 hypothetical protein SAMN04487772_12824 [[Clostridium] polysaccharolyticum]